MTASPPETADEAAAEIDPPHPAPVRWWPGIFPGLALTFGLAAIAYGLNRMPGFSNFSPMILSIGLGVLVRNTVGAPDWARAGIVFSLKRLLRLAIMLLGLQLTLGQIAAVGAAGLAVVLVSMAFAYFFTLGFARLIGVDAKLAQLIGAGTSICGASAVIAANTVVRADEEDAAYAVACVTVFGSLAMFLYPLAPPLLDLAPKAYGLWAGASIHEVAQVVAAAFQNGPESGEMGTIAKLSRVILLAPLVLGMAFVAARTSGGGGGEAKAPLPLFVFGFIAMVVLASVVPLSPEVKEAARLVTVVLLSAALAAMGLETDIRKLKAKGLRPLALGGAATIAIAAVSLGLILLFRI